MCVCSTMYYVVNVCNIDVLMSVGFISPPRFLPVLHPLSYFERTGRMRKSYQIKRKVFEHYVYSKLVSDDQLIKF